VITVSMYGIWSMEYGVTVITVSMYGIWSYGDNRKHVWNMELR
jgi:hypothetical protein